MVQIGDIVYRVVDGQFFNSSAQNVTCVKNHNQTSDCEGTLLEEYIVQEVCLQKNITKIANVNSTIVGSINSTVSVAGEVTANQGTGGTNPLTNTELRVNPVVTTIKSSANLGPNIDIFGELETAVAKDYIISVKFIYPFEIIELF